MVKALIGNLDEELVHYLPIWRLVTEKVATLKEIDEHYSFVDIIKANAVLDMKNEVEKAIGSIVMQQAEK